MTPLVVIDVETTGLPDRTDGFVPLVIEVGACVVDRLGVVRNPISFLVAQPPDHVASPSAAEALRINKLTPAMVATGLPPTEAADRLAAWLRVVAQRYGADRVTAFNAEFDLGMLSAPPWSFPERGIRPGPCVMLGAMSVMGPAGVLPPAPEGCPPDQRWKWPRAREAIIYFKPRYPGLPWLERRDHRARDDAWNEGCIASAIHKDTAGGWP